MSKATKKPEAVAPAEEHKQRKTRFIKVKKVHLFIGVLVLVIVGGVGVGYKLYDNQKKEIARLSDPQQSAKAETDKIKKEVSSLIELPGNEDPTIATVVDSTKLTNQAFFSKAKNGDRVIMYAEAKKAVLYRPDTKKIIEVAPINIGNNAASAAQQPTQQPGVTTTP